MFNITQRWFRRRAIRTNPQSLSSRQVYILPSAFGWVYGITLAGIASGAINYQLNAAYFLVFLLMVIGFWGMWQAHDNLKNVSIHCLEIRDVEEGQPVKINLLLNGKNQMKYALHFSFPGEEPVKLDVLPTEGINLVLPLKTTHRGQFSIPPIKVYTFFPLSLFRVWSWLYFEMEYIVYPAAISPGFWPEADSKILQDESLVMGTGDDELYELINIESPWVQPGRIAWKISARGQGWFLKSMKSPMGENWLFRIQDLPEQDIELCLRQLSFWLQTAENNAKSYGLELKGFKTEISQGEEHLKYCLRKLALYS